MKIKLMTITIMSVGTAAFAGLTETGATRTVDSAANNGLIGAQNITVTHSDVGPATGSWIGGDYISSFGNGPYSDTDVFQNSTIDPGHYFGSMFNGVIVDPSGDPLNFPSSDSQSLFAVEFTLSTPEDFTLSGWINPYGLESGITSEVTVSIINTGVGGTPTQVIANATNDLFQSFNVTDTLLAGDYRFEVFAIANAQALGEDYFFNGGADATWDMTVTPEPASLALLTVGGLVCLRRRN